MLLVEVLGIDLTPLSSCPCREVYAIGDVANVVLLGIVACPDVGKHLLADPAVKFRYTVDLLAGVAGKGRHAELLALIVGIGTTHTDELVPADTQLLRIAAHILAEETFIEVVVASRNRGVDSVKTRSTHQLQCLVEIQALINIVTQTLQVAECGVALVTMVDVLLDAELLQEQHTADTEQDFLLQAVFPVTAVEAVSDGLVEVGVHLVVGVKQIELHTADIDTPNISVNHIISIRNINHQRIAFLVDFTNNGKAVEVLRLIVGNLLTVHREALCKVAETIEEADGTHIDVRIGSLLHVVTSQHAKTATVDLQGRVHTVLHAEVGH